jgi:AraC family transcriptional regulator
MAAAIRPTPSSIVAAGLPCVLGLGGMYGPVFNSLILDEVCLPFNCQNEAMSGSRAAETARSANARRWAGVEVRLTERHPGPGETWTPILADSTTVIIRLDQRGGIAESRLEPVPPVSRGRREPGFFNWIPENRTIWWYADSVDCVRDLQLRFEHVDVATILGDAFAPLDLREPLLMVYDTRVAHCADALADVFTRGFQDDNVYAENLTTALLVALHSAASGQFVALPPGSLAPWQLRIVKDHLEEHLGSDTNLIGVANLVGLSQSRLVRGFKASTGLAPYMWVMRARIEKAKRLLLNERTSLSEIALETGFADQSHFTKAFKRGVGMTPGQWRRNKSLRS